MGADHERETGFAAGCGTQGTENIADLVDADIEFELAHITPMPIASARSSNTVLE
jgi:hypothetical protein